ncbi:MAG: Uma2 family endonuclease [Chloroflexaceae bacterium]|nr:Uma2 family endonuclease [Chloroflexaceae bacterium]
MVQNKRLLNLPHPDELPDTDDTPVDNELHLLVPLLLSLMLAQWWQKRQDWFFGVNMGIYHTTGENPHDAIVPDGFLCLGVERTPSLDGRRNYVTWAENDVVPILVVEHLSPTYGGEYEWSSTPRKVRAKMGDYARLGVLYYAIYNPRGYVPRKRREPFEVYRLEKGMYQRLPGDPVWMPEIGLGLGRDGGTFRDLHREWLFWYDESGQRSLTPDEVNQQERQRAEQERQRAEREHQRAEQEHQRAEQERQRADRLAQLLRDRGIEIE